MPKQIHQLPPASAVADSDLTNIKQGLNDSYASVAQILDNIGTAIDRADAKASPADTDSLALSDSEADGLIKKVSWSNFKAAIKTYFESVVFTWALRQVFTIGLKLSASSGAIRFGSGDISTSADFDMDEATSANVLFRFFRNTNTSGARQVIVYKGDGSDTVALLFDAENDTLEIAGNTVWHAGNDGPGSGLNADLLDGASTGTAVGNIPVLEDVGGTPGLPAVDGSQLLNIVATSTTDEEVKASPTDNLPGTLLEKLDAGDGISFELLDEGYDEKLQIKTNLQPFPKQHFIVRCASDAQSTINFGDTINDDVDSPYQGPVKNHLIFRNGQLLVNKKFDDHISPDEGDYEVTNAMTGEITLTEAADTGEIFVYIDIRSADAVIA